MRRFCLATLAFALLVALVPSQAPAKGTIEASLAGPGLDTPIPFGWAHDGTADDPRRAPFQHVALATGFFTVAFDGASLETWDAASKALRARRPQGDLGPRYTLTYRFEGPGGGDELVQDVYPFAEPRPVTYIAFDQLDQLVHTPGSWFVADDGLREALVEAGLPPGSSSREDGFPWAALAALVAGALVLALRLRPRPAL